MSTEKRVNVVKKDKEERTERQGSSRKRPHEDTVTTSDNTVPNSDSPRLLKVGDLCSVFFDLGVDFFRPGKLEGVLGGWYPATVESISPRGKSGKLYNITVKSNFFDIAKKSKSKKGEVFTYPSPMVRLLYEDDSGSLRHESDDKLMFKARPERLSQGDLVYGRFQNGNENGRWFRGRVAAVYELKNGTPVCDIAYDDGDFEVHVPYRASSGGTDAGVPNVYLCASELSKEWIMGLDIPVTCDDDDKNEDKNDRVVVVHMSNGKTVQLSYSEVVETLFRKAREEALRIVEWPSTGTA